MISYTALSAKSIKYIKKLKQKKFRDLYNQFIAEGIRLLEEALANPHVVISDIVIREDMLDFFENKRLSKPTTSHKINISTTDHKTFKLLSDEITPSGILFVAEKHAEKVGKLQTCIEKNLIYLDRISEPGNLGAILRSADWFGIRTIILSPGCVDPFNPKVVRASAGAIFRLHIFQNVDLHWIMNSISKSYQLVATVPVKATDLHQWQNKGKNIIFFGNEAEGLHTDILESADLLISIPRTGKTESLNLSVAAGIIFYHLQLKND